MPESLLPDEAIETGSVTISVGIGPHGQHVTAYHVDSMATEAAIGYLIATADILRESIKFQWFAEELELDEDEED